MDVVKEVLHRAQAGGKLSMRSRRGPAKPKSGAQSGQVDGRMSTRRARQEFVHTTTPPPPATGPAPPATCATHLRRNEAPRDLLPVHSELHHSPAPLSCSTHRATHLRRNEAPRDLLPVHQGHPEVPRHAPAGSVELCVKEEVRLHGTNFQVLLLFLMRGCFWEP